MIRNAQVFPVKVTKKIVLCHPSTNMHIYVRLRHVLNASFFETKFALFVLFQMYNLNGPLVKLMSYLFLNIVCLLFLKVIKMLLEILVG